MRNKKIFKAMLNFLKFLDINVLNCDIIKSHGLIAQLGRATGS